MNNSSNSLKPVVIDATIVGETINPMQLDYADNPQPRCPVVLLLDCSTSMNGAPIQELQRGVEHFLSEMSADPIASSSVEVCLIPFGKSVSVLRGFSSIAETVSRPLPTLQANGNTPMGEAMELAQREIKERRNYYKRQGVSSYKPWVVLLTDGQPNDDWEQPAENLRIKATRNEMVMVAVGIGHDVDMQTLRRIAPVEPGAQRLQGLKFANFFRWLSDSLQQVSSGSTVNQHAAPSMDGYDWAL